MAGELERVDAKTVKNWMDGEEVLLIDVREKEEVEYESIPQAVHCPLSSFDPKLVPGAEGKKVVFHCAAGVRSDRAAKLWLTAGFGEKAYNFSGGIEEWGKEGFPLVRDHSQARQLQAKAYRFFGILVLLSAFLAVFVSSWFLLGTALVGSFLFLSGWKGDSLLVLLLKKIPFNT